ncbi:uncharacterized protein LOC135497311 [Lineus longissimus]|uniref:uncharacterized protein LOC135497311 n=1 Tax=Lineus longissimus TaxID=88925 RepID=UPI00315DF701
MFWRFLCVVESWSFDILSRLTGTGWDKLDSSRKKNVTPWRTLCMYCTFLFSWVKGLLLNRVQSAGIDNNEQLLRQSRFGSVSALQSLVKDGADVNAKDKVSDQTALMYSTANGNSDVTSYLVEAGADVNARDNTGQSALMIAAQVGYSDIAKCLVEAGADVNAQDIYNKSALWLSAWYGHIDIVGYLIEAGADVDVEAKRDDTSTNAFAIAMATEFGHKETVLALIKAGANINLYFNERTLLSIAATNGHKDVFLALHEAGATENRYNFISMLEDCIKDGHLEISQLIGNLVADDDVIRSDILRMFEKIPYQDGILCIDSLRTLILLFDKLNIPISLNKSSIPFQDTIDYGTHSALCERGNLLTNTSTLPEDLASLPNVSELITCPGIGNINCLPNGTAEEISKFTYDVVLAMVEKLNSDIDTEHNLGSAVMVKCGSAAEGTKTVLPDEFDYDITFKTDRETGQVVDFRHDNSDDGYKFYSRRKTNEAVKIGTNSQTKGSKIFHIEFFDRLISGQAVENIQIDSMVKGGGQPNTAIKIVWQEPNTNHKLPISVDLVPVLQFAGEWPEYLIEKTWLMDKEMLKSRGFCLVAKPPHADSDLGKRMREKDQEYERTQLWRISFAHLEAEHIAKVQPRIRDAYVAAKCLRNPDVCRIMFRDKDGILNNADKYVSSYMLKTVFLHKVEDFLENEKSLIEMVDIIYTELERCLEDKVLPLFWQPGANHIAGMKGDPKKALRVAKLMREFVGRLKMREMDSDTKGTESNGKLTEQSRQVSDTDPLKSKECEEAPSENKPLCQCLPALCPLGYYVIMEIDDATDKNSREKEDCSDRSEDKSNHQGRGKMTPF